MGYLEDRIGFLQERIQRIEQNPDPAKLKSTRLIYEAELELRQSQVEAWRNGKAFAEGPGPMYALLRAVGFEIVDSVRAADRIPAEQVPKYFDAVRALGFPDTFCDRTILRLPLIFGDNDLPKPSIMLNPYGACELGSTSANVIAHQLGVPCFTIDVPSDDDYKKHLGYITRQIEEFIRFAEATVPGTRFDEGKLVEFQELESRWYKGNHHLYELKKSIPCPLHPQDSFRQHTYPCTFPNPAKAVEYIESYTDELRARVKEGYSPLGEEKLRILWTISGPFGSKKIWNLFVEKGVAIPYTLFGGSGRVHGTRFPPIGDITEFGRKLTPIEELAKIVSYNSWGGTANRWIEEALFICREVKVDAIVNYNLLGCTPTMSLSKLLAEAAERELGIPSVSVVGRELDYSASDEQGMLEQLSAFIDRCIDQKGLSKKRR